MPVAKVCADAREHRYFPAGAFSDPIRDLPYNLPWGDQTGRGHWYAEHLAAMEEPSLYCDALTDDETYRLLWLRTFDYPVAVRIFRRSEHYGVEAVIMDGQGGYEPGSVSRRVTKSLSTTQWHRVVAALEEAGFWQMATGVRDVIGIDGAQWVIEARVEGRYHAVSRYAGSDGTHEIGDIFLDIAALDESALNRVRGMSR